MTRNLIMIVAVLVLAAGGYWFYLQREAAIEAELRAAAIVIPEQSRHGIDVIIEGREVILSGLVDDQAEAERLVALARELPGQRGVTVDLALLPSMSPYLFEARKALGGGLTGLKGAVPDREAAGRIAEALPDLDYAEVYLASGAPESGWSDAILVALAALDATSSGTLRIEDESISIWGEVEEEATLISLRQQAEGALEGYEWSINIDVTRPAIAEFVLRAEKSEGEVRLFGPMPGPASARQLTDLLGDSVAAGGPRIDIGAGAPEGWIVAALAGTEALLSLKDGVLDLKPGVLELSGTASDEETLRAAEALLIPVAAEGFEVVISVRLDTP